MTLEELDRKCCLTGFMFSLLSNNVYRGIFRPHEGLPLIRVESLAALRRETACLAQECPEASASHRKGRSSKCIGDIPVSPESVNLDQCFLLDSLARMIRDENRRPVEVVKCGGWPMLLRVVALRKKRVKRLSKGESLARQPLGTIATQWIYFEK